MNDFAVIAHLGLAGGGPITAFSSARWAMTMLSLPVCAMLVSPPLLLAAACWPALQSADLASGIRTAVIAAAAAVTGGAAAGIAVVAAGIGALVGREGGGAGARRVGGFMWLLVLQSPRDELCLGSKE